MAIPARRYHLGPAEAQGVSVRERAIILSLHASRVANDANRSERFTSKQGLARVSERDEPCDNDGNNELRKGPPVYVAAESGRSVFVCGAPGALEHFSPLAVHR